MRKIYLMVLLLAVLFHSSAQAPASWTINPGDWSHDMSVTAVLSLSGRVSDNNSDVVAAFFGTEVRGVASPSIVVPSTGQVVVFLSVYSNTPIGETLTFQMYDAVNDEVIDAVVDVEFVSNGQVGSNTDPFLITNNYDPTDITLSNASIPENTASNTLVGQLTTTDQNHSTGFVYTLVSGEGDDDNALFTISGDELLTAVEFNFEEADTRTIRVQTLDPMNSTYEESFTIWISDENDVPTDIGLSGSDLDENNAPSAIVGTLSTEDADANESFVYSITGTDASSFAILNDNELALLPSADFETQSSYEIDITTQDRGGTGLTFTESFTVSINDVNESPTDTQISNNEIAEQAEIGDLIGTFTVTDEDFEDTHFYKFDNGTDTDGVFIISGEDLLLASPLDYRERSLYLITIVVTDAGDNSFSKLFEINILDSTPDIPDTVLDVDENSEVGTVVGAIEGTDPDGDPLIYSFVFDDPFFDPNEAPFIIDANTGVVSVNISEELDFEESGEFIYLVQAEDEGGRFDQAELKILINDVIEPDSPLPVNEIITPNNDGYNDIFRVINIELYSEYSLKVFNSNGVEVFTASPYENTWDGRSNNGKDLDSGLYYYRFSDGTILFKGKVTIIRD